MDKHAYQIQCPAGEDKDRPPNLVFFKHILPEEYTELQLQAAFVSANNDSLCIKSAFVNSKSTYMTQRLGLFAWAVPVSSVPTLTRDGTISIDTSFF